MANREPRIFAAYKKLAEAQASLHTTVFMLLPEGTKVQWEQRRGVLCEGEVTRTGFENVFVRNCATKKEYRISADKITRIDTPKCERNKPSGAEVDA